MKPRVLWCNECSVLKTGYAIYGNEVLNRLHSMGKYVLAEHASYIHHSDPRTKNLPWTVYANLPDADNEKQVNQYKSKPANQFGEWRFEEICLNMRPHITIDIRDQWMMNFEYTSPLRSYYNRAIMPTVDAFPQNEEWLCQYIDADGVFTYQDWSHKVLENEGGGRINLLGAAPPAAAPEFQPLDRKQIKQNCGLQNVKIIGTVMRNQRRKLFPDLFEAFSIFLKETKRNDILLYCHTSYPDMGWDIPKLLLTYGIADKVLFTYKCKRCGHVFPNFFSDILCDCPKCHSLTAAFSSVQDGADNDQLARIYNLFDVYTQISNSEGFGIPIIEAAACGTPVITTDYSAMTDVVRKLKGRPISLSALTLELETGCFRAVPNKTHLIKELIAFFSLEENIIEQIRQETHQAYNTHYSWDTTAQKWASYFDSVDVEKYEKAWRSPPNYIEIPNQYPNINNKDFARWLINLLGDPRFVNSYMEARLIRDLNYGVTSTTLSGMYYNEDSAMFQKPQFQHFNKEIAFKHFVGLAERKNYWEKKRWESLQK